MAESANEPNREAIAALEDFLRDGRIIGIDIPQVDSGFHKEKVRLMLEGPLVVMGKPENGVEEPFSGRRVIVAEAAAWAVARDLGWTDLVPVTVIRSIPTLQKAEVMSSVQIVVPSPMPGLPPYQISEDQIWKAAVFDYLVQQSDRYSRNWLTINAYSSHPRLVLIDHGLCFRVHPALRTRSVFIESKAGQPLPESILTALESFIQKAKTSDLEEVLAGFEIPGYERLDAFEGLVARAEQLLEDGYLPPS